MGAEGIKMSNPSTAIREFTLDLQRQMYTLVVTVWKMKQQCWAERL